MHSSHSLGQLGWSATFSQQLTLAEWESRFPARVAAVHRSHLEVLSERGAFGVTVPPRLFGASHALPVAVGDWVLVENDAPRVARVLERSTVLSRMAAGIEQRPQLIAANLDTLFIVTSCNQDFNPARLERYLTLAAASQIAPVIVLTKPDLCATSEERLHEARALVASESVVMLNATQSGECAVLAPWLASGQAVAFVGSSGVGKSTLINSLLARPLQATSGIREDDSRGRHTTTARQMFALPGGAWVIDTPGMRELKIGAVDVGIDRTFAEIDTLARRCRFRDCRHEQEAGCAVLAAIADGTLEARRLDSYAKLRREAAQAARSLRERRAHERHLGRVHRSALKQQKELKGR